MNDCRNGAGDSCAGALAALFVASGALLLLRLALRSVVRLVYRARMPAARKPE